MELVRTALNELERLNPFLNAIIFNNKENALNAARQADLEISKGKIRGPLHGIPITIKDNIEVADAPTTAGFRFFKNHLPTKDAHLVHLLKEAGAIIIGKTNLPALTCDLQTNNKLFGRTNNAWNLDHTPGGSSGGCASVVAAGISRISFCNDSGGSIRIPAHFSGVYGLKTSLGGINTQGMITQTRKKVGPLNMRTLLSSGMLGQSVGDLKVALSIIHTSKLNLPDKEQRSANSLKLLWINELPGFEVDHEIKNAFSEFRLLLEKAGVHLVDFTHNQFDFLETIRLWGHLSNYETGNELPAIARYAGHLIMRRKYAKIPMYTDLLKPISSKKYRSLRKHHETVKANFEKMLDAYDGLIIPPSSVLAFPHQQPDRYIRHLGIYTSPLNVNDRKVQYAIAIQSYTLPFNVLESPVVSLPISLSDNNLPIGIQLVGKKNGDFDLLEVAAALDKLLPSIGSPNI